MANAMVSVSEELYQIIETLEKPEVRHSLQRLLEKLPNVEQTIESAENVVDFGKAVLADGKTIDRYEHFASTYNVGSETITAIVQLIEKLPKLVQIIHRLEDIIDFVTAVLQDKQTTEYTANNLKGYIDPYVEKGKMGMEFLKMVQQRAEGSPQHINVFSIIKWMKDPSVQRSLNYVQSALDILKEKN
ncbi:hypothetical protein P4562_20450 [Lysinibacillus xylanilyticus]|uniref:hypothetical protein n=1 Tax=Lysinibacillus xylanilyticus TaxID=582475 RepID=UPI002E2492ED|nr:hypothetical protein [Lysinibacillus xylanilyticus]